MDKGYAFFEILLALGIFFVLLMIPLSDMQYVFGFENPFWSHYNCTNPYCGYN
jgi:hypothetical protein